MISAAEGAWERANDDENGDEGEDIDDEGWIPDIWRCRKLCEESEVCSILLSGESDEKPSFIRRGVMKWKESDEDGEARDGSDINWEYEFNYGLLGSVTMQSMLDNGLRVCSADMTSAIKGNDNAEDAWRAEVRGTEIAEALGRVRMMEQNMFAPLIKKINEASRKRIGIFVSDKAASRQMEVFREAARIDRRRAHIMWIQFLGEGLQVHSLAYLKSVYDLVGAAESFEEIMRKRPKCAKAFVELVYANSVCEFDEIF